MQVKYFFLINILELNDNMQINIALFVMITWKQN